jgi:NADH dehydrogenase
VIFVAGGTGFIGRHLIRTLIREGHKIKCLARSSDAERTCIDLGCESTRGDITARDSLDGAIDGASTAVHLVGIIKETGKQSYKSLHVEGTKNLIDEAKKAGIKHFVYISSLGTGSDSGTAYHETKAMAEEMVKNSGLGFTIFRPSIVIGSGDEFVSKLKGSMPQSLPFIPVPGKGTAEFQPIYVGDLVECIRKAIENAPEGRTHELGGPDHLSYNEMVLAIAEAMGKSNRLIHIPLWLVRPAVKLLEKALSSPVTSDQLRMLETDNTCSTTNVKDTFGFEPLSFREALKVASSDEE